MDAKTVVAAALVLSVSAAYAQDEDEITKAKDVFMGCVYASVEDMDDGVSDANTIASAVADTCAKLGRAAFEHRVSSAELAADPELKVYERDVIMKLARKVVLWQRVDKSKKTK